MASDALGMMTFASAVVALGCVIGVVVALVQRGRYRREWKAVQAGRYPGSVAYQRYAQSRVGQVLGFALLVLALVVVATLAIWSSVASGADGNAPLSGLTTITIMLAFVILVFALPLWLFSLLVSTTAYAPALANLRGLPTSPRDFLILRLKATVGLIPTLAVIGAALVLVVLGVPDWIPLVVLAGGLIVVLVVFSRLRVALLRWYYPTRPIEQAQWAGLASRAREWGARTGVRVRAVYMREMARYGSGDTLISGTRRHCTLFLSDTFLAASEWRQQDAMICMSLGMLAGTRRQRVQRYISLATLAVALLALYLVTAVLPTLSDSAQELLILLVGLVALLAALVGSIVLFVWRFTSREARPNTMKARVLRSDLLAAELTGDPMAVMATINAAIALAGAAPGTRSVAGYPSAAERIQALDQWAHQPGPRAPWAGEPVPCIVPVQIGPFTLTTPLTDAAKQAAPQPVPTTPYPAVGYPAPVAPMAAAGYPPAR